MNFFTTLTGLLTTTAIPKTDLEQIFKKYPGA